MDNDLATYTGRYLYSVHALTPANDIALTEVIQTGKTSDLAPAAYLVTYVPIFLFFLIFVVAFVFQIAQRVRNWKNVTTAIVIALFFASIPFILPSVRENVHFTPQAGPEEVPRDLTIAKIDNESILVTWETGAARKGAVKVWEAHDPKDKKRILISSKGESTNHHSVLIDKFTLKTTYELEILSGFTWYNDNGRDITFTFQ